MKKLLIGAVVIVVLVLLGFMFLGGPYNTMISKSENVEGAWSEVETQYQRRSDLFMNVVNTIKGSAEFERGVLTDVIEARSKATSVNIDADELTPENLQKFQDAQSGLSSAFSRLMVVAEQYPQLQSTSSFRDFQAQIEGTENRINKARNDFNKTVKDYNVYVKRFPNNIVAGLFGFDSKAYFEAEDGLEKSPEVKF